MSDPIVEVVEPEKKTRGRKKKVAETLPVLASHETWAREALEVVSGWEITDQQEMDQAGALLAQVFDKKKELQAELKAITDPIRSKEKEARDHFRPAIGFCESTETALKKIMREFELKRRKEQDAALALVAESGGEATADTLMVAHGHGQVQLPQTVNGRSVLKFEVTDESLIPEKYFMRILNEKAIEAEVKMTEGKCNIPGIRVYEDVQISNRARSVS